MKDEKEVFKELEKVGVKVDKQLRSITFDGRCRVEGIGPCPDTGTVWVRISQREESKQ